MSAPLDVVAQEITSEDGGVALISASGTVTANGAISAIEDVTLGAKENVVAQTINTQFGTVALVSTEGTVTVNSDISGGIEVVISAKQNVSAGQILAGTVAINSEQGTVTLTGNVIADGGDIYISASGNIVLQNLISYGGAITIISEQGAVTTGYLRSDGYGKGGKIYLQAFGYIRVISSVNIGGTEYSIYTGIDKKGWIRVVHQSSVQKISQKSSFVIGDASFNGTVADVSKPPVLKPQPKPIKPGVRGGLILIIIEIFRQILDGGIADAPTQVDHINPITNEPYSGDTERELVKKLNPAQRGRLKELINKKTDEGELLKKEEFRKGKVDDKHGCFSVELGEHLGTFLNHSLYATYITGSTGDFLVVSPKGKASYAFYDGLVKPSGAIVTPHGFESVGSVAEVKTKHEWLKKYLLPSSRYYLNQPKTPDNIRDFGRITLQINIYSRVALECGLKFFISFDNVQAGRAGRELFEYRTPLVTERPVKVHYVPPRAGLYPP